MDLGKSHEVRSLAGPSRTIRIRYRRFGLWGSSPAGLGTLLLLWALLSGAGLAALSYLGGPASYRLWAGLALAVSLAGSAACFLAHAARRVIDGRVLHRRIIHSGEQGVPDEYYVAIDDGHSTRVTALAVSPQLYQQLVEGATVRAKTTAWLGHVVSIQTIFPAQRANPAPVFPLGDEELAVPARFAQSALEAPVEMTALPPLADADGPIDGVLGYVYAPVGTRIIGTGTVGDHLQVYQARSMPAAERMVAVLAAQSASKPLPPSALQEWKRGPWKHALLHVRPRGEGALAFRLYRRDVNSVFSGAARLNEALRKRK